MDLSFKQTCAFITINNFKDYLDIIEYVKQKKILIDFPNIDDINNFDLVDNQNQERHFCNLEQIILNKKIQPKDAPQTLLEDLEMLIKNRKEKLVESYNLEQLDKSLLNEVNNLIKNLNIMKEFYLKTLDNFQFESKKDKDYYITEIEEECDIKVNVKVKGKDETKVESKK
jgi:hypothetical protein